MVRFVEIVAVVLVAITMALTLAHALELPGKLRLDREQYFAVQTIYYPGFTIGGGAEILGILVLALLLYLTPFGGARFLWTLSALALLVAVHGIYWVFTHPVNNFWVRDVELSGLGSTFFSAFAPKTEPGDWKSLRDVWEYSHVARAALAMLSLIAITIAVTSAHAPGEPGSG
ncbi:DUF1772 domain-containing protein [Mesorhizobium sp. WSM2239]|jgi:hypothetical protein|uniref:DUF1772 domain-containing protein n=2 Tax=unclassified Mesorhizobium TaxID=325217 RepID=A0AAU8D203_9HYPH